MALISWNELLYMKRMSYSHTIRNFCDICCCSVVYFFLNVLWTTVGLVFWKTVDFMHQGLVSAYSNYFKASFKLPYT